MNFSSWLSSSESGGGVGTGSVNVEKSGAWPLVERATSDFLVTPDWAANLECVDFGNASEEHAKAVAASIEKRLLAKKSPRIPTLAIELMRACAKNGQHALLMQTSKVMSTVAKLATRSDSMFARTSTEWLQVEQQALALIQELGQEFRDKVQAYPGFYNTYASLTRQGVIFPIVPGTQPPSPPTSSASAGSSSRHIIYESEASAMSAMGRQGRNVSKKSEKKSNTNKGPRAIKPEEVEKLEHDLMMLSCKMDVADHLLDEGSALDSEEILDVLEFLLQCKPRMVKLIEASAMGLLSDEFLGECLKINDRLCIIVDVLEGRQPRLEKPKKDENQQQKEPSPDRVGAESIPMLAAPSKDVHFQQKSKPVKQNQNQKQKQAEDDEEIDLYGLPPTALSDGAVAAAAATSEPENPFDFFANS